MLVPQNLPESLGKTAQFEDVHSNESLISWLKARIASLFPKQISVPKLKFTEKTLNKLVVIGVQGWFPEVWLIKLMLGQPIGTSEKFCDKMCSSFSKFESRFNPNSLDITSIPLSNGGQIKQRTRQSFDLIKSNSVYFEALKSADIVLVAAHSQGTIVATLVLNQLIQDGILSLNRQRIGALYMAGIGHGPLVSLKRNLVVRYVEKDAARELFQFCRANWDVADIEYDPQEIQVEGDENSLLAADSSLSNDVVREYWNSMKTILEQGVRITCVGSFSDPVVPLYSSLFYAFNHPNLFRAMYVDSKYVSIGDPVNADTSFIVEFVGFLIELKNAGINDCEVLKNLSDMLALGMISSADGHSNLYDDSDIYQLAIKWLFHGANNDRSSRSSNTPCTIEQFEIPRKFNPYHLPWSIRGLVQFIADGGITDGFIRAAKHKHFISRLKQLLQVEYPNWRPKSKTFKDIKYRMEAVKLSKL